MAVLACPGSAFVMKMQEDQSPAKHRKHPAFLFECILSLLVIALLIIFVLPRVPHTGHVASPRTYSGNNLKQIGIAMEDFVNSYGAFPLAAYCDKEGRPLYSWRVLLLPFLEEQSLYQQFNPDEPWDGPNNKLLLERMPTVYRHPLGNPKDLYATHYQVFTGGGAIFDHNQQPILRFADIIDGCSPTFTVVEAGTAVPWTKPEDLHYSPDKPLPRLGGIFPDGFNALTADGRVHWVRKNPDEKIIRAMITYKGGEEDSLRD